MKTNDNSLKETVIRLQRELAIIKTENTQLKEKFNTFSNNDKEFITLRKLIALMPGNIFWKDKDGRLLGCNNNLAEILCLQSPEEIIGKQSIDLIGEEFANQVDEVDREIMSSTEPTVVEEHGFDKNQQPAVYLSHKIPLKNQEGEIIGLLGTSLDITLQKKLEKELQSAKEKAEASSRAKSQFLAVINHELRTPLTGIIGLINILKQGNISGEEYKNVTADLENCSKNLLSLVNDVLDFTRLESGRFHIHPAPLNLRELVDEIFGMLSTIAENKGLKLQSHFDESLPTFIMSDSRILRQSLINLINNAIKFTENGLIEVRIDVLEKASKTITLNIAVRDTGPGIPEDKLNLIFEPFQQLENIYLRQSSRSGTGLGLSIVKRLAARLGLKVYVESELGKGSTFSLKGEFKLSAQKEIMQNKMPENDITYTKKIKTLLVEDDRIVQYVHKRMLMELGCEVDTAINGYDALKLLNDQHEIIFVDIGLGDITGFEVIKEIRERKKNPDLPVIALTGYTGEEEKQECLMAGANEVRGKPISAESLQEILARYCGQQ